MNSDDVTNPYVGPIPYQESQKEYFFGRDLEAEILLSLAITERIVVFYAQSGAGKSSLVNTRLIPNLREREYKVLPTIRIGGELPLDISAEKVDNIYVFNALNCLNEGKSPKSLLGETLHEFLAKKKTEQHEATTPHYLIVDQFEEILTTHYEHWRKREDFFLQLCKALNADSKLNVVFVLQEDHLAGLDRYASLFPDGLRVRYRMERLGRTAALEAIERPAAKKGRPYEPGVAETIVNDLSRLRIADRKKTFIGEFAEPVYLQIYCFQLWEKLTNADAKLADKNSLKQSKAKRITKRNLLKFGSVDNALRKFYDSKVKQVAEQTTTPEVKIRRWFGSSLITPTRVRAQVAQGRADSAGLPSRAVKMLLEAPLIRIVEARGGRWIELAHDRLVEPILADNQAWETEHLHPFQRQAALWKERNRPEALLIGGAALEEAERRVRAHEVVPTDDEKEYLQACRQEQQRRLRRLLLPQALAAHAFVQLNAGEDERAALLARQAYLFNQEMLSRETLGQGHTLQDQIREAASSEQVLYDVLSALCASHILKKHQGQVSSIAFSPDRQILATGGYDCQVYLWNVQQPCEKPRVLDTLPAPVRSLAFSNRTDLPILAVGSDDRVVRLYMVNEQVSKLIDLHGHQDWVTSLAFAPGLEDEILASGSRDQTVRLWRVREPGRQSILLGKHSWWVWSVAFHPDGKTLAVGVRDGTVWLWDVTKSSPDPKILRDDCQRKKTVGTEEGQDGEGEVFCVTFSPKGRMLAAACRDRVVRLWTMDQSNEWNDPPTLLTGHENWVRSVAFSHDGGLLASGSEDQTVRLWDPDDHKTPLAILGGHHGGGISSVAFSRDSEKLASGLWSNVVKLWSVSELRPVRRAQDLIYSIDFSLDGKTLASGSKDGVVCLWDIDQPGNAPRRRRGHYDKDKDLHVRAVAFSPRDRNLLISAGDDALRLWNVYDGNLKLERCIDESAVTSVAFSPTGQMLASGGYKNTIKLWSMDDLRTPVKVLPMQGPDGDKIRTLAFHPLGTMLASGGTDKKVRLWKLEETRAGLVVSRYRVLDGPRGEIRSVSFRPKGSLLVAGSSDDRMIYIWNLENIDADPTRLPGPQFGIGSLTFRPDGEVLAVGGWDHTVQLWSDFRPTAVPLVLHGHGGGVSCVRFSPDGRRRLASGSHDYTIRIWGGGIDVAADMVCKKVCHNLSKEEWRVFVGSDIDYYPTCGDLLPDEDATADIPATAD